MDATDAVTMQRDVVVRIRDRAHSAGAIGDERSRAEFTRFADAHLRIREALIVAQRALEMLIEPNAIKQTTSVNAWAACVEAEAKARAALTDA
jgi:hypothetical protein